MASMEIHLKETFRLRIIRPKFQPELNPQLLRPTAHRPGAGEGGSGEYVLTVTPGRGRDPVWVEKVP